MSTGHGWSRKVKRRRRKGREGGEVLIDQQEDQKSVIKHSRIEFEFEFEF